MAKHQKWEIVFKENKYEQDDIKAKNVYGEHCHDFYLSFKPLMPSQYSAVEREKLREFEKEIMSKY